MCAEIFLDNDSLLLYRNEFSHIVGVYENALGVSLPMS